MAQINGIVRHLEGNSRCVLHEALPAVHHSPLFRTFGPPPKPWRGHSALWFPSDVSATAVAEACAALQAQGLFVVNTTNRAAHQALSDFTIWKVDVLHEQQLFSALFFDASNRAQTRSAMRSSRSIVLQRPPIEEVPNWPDDHQQLCPPVPIMASKLREPRMPATPRSISQRPRLSRSLKAPLPSTGDDGPEPFTNSYESKTFAPMFETTPFPVHDTRDAFMDISANGCGKPASCDDSKAYLPPNMPSAREHHPGVWKAVQEDIALGLTSPASDRPKFPNNKCSNQPHSHPIGATAKGSKWESAAIRLEARLGRQFPQFLAKHSISNEQWLKMTGRGKTRVVTNGSSDPGTGWGLNERNYDHAAEVLHHQFSDIVAATAHYGPNTVWIIFDIKRAYKTLRLRPSALWAYCFQLVDPVGKTKWFTDLTNVFGSTDAESGFQLFMSVFSWLLAFGPNNDCLRNFMYHVDNCYVAVPPKNGKRDEQRVDRTLHQLYSFLRKAGFVVDGDPDEQKKTKINTAYTHEHEVTTHFVSLGWVMDSGDSPRVSFKPARQALLDIVLSDWIRDGAFSKTEADKVLGVLSWAGNIFPLFRAYSAHVRFEIKSALKKNPFAQAIKASPTTQEALVSLRQLINTDIGSSLQIAPRMAPGAPFTHMWRTDASTVIGYGLVDVTYNVLLADTWSKSDLKDISRVSELETTCCSSNGNTRLSSDDDAEAWMTSAATDAQNSSSAHAEALGLLKWVKRRLPKNAYLLVQADSDNLARAWARGWSPVPELNAVLREMRVICENMGTMLVIHHILRDENQTADALSKQVLETERLFAITAAEFGEPKAKLFKLAFGE